MNKLFVEEIERLEERKSLLDNETIDKDVLLKSYSDLINEHKELIDQAILITKVSDRLQNKLDKTNEKLSVTNQKLKKTIDLLDEAKIGRKASTIIFLAAIALFFISEIIIEPSIDFIANSFYIGLGLKALIAILIKPVEDLLEEKMQKDRRKEIIQSTEMEIY
jgi:vacuolar-type H+-ATPase subunit I/STV1